MATFLKIPSTSVADVGCHRFVLLPLSGSYTVDDFSLVRGEEDVDGGRQVPVRQGFPLKK